MKKYIKPAMEVVAVESLQPMVASEIIVDQTGTVIDPTGGDGGSGQWAPGKKGRVYIVEDEEDFGW